MIFQICLAEQVIEIHSLYDNVFAYCKDYIVQKQAAPSLIVEIDSKDIQHEDAMNLYEERRRNLKVYMTYSPKYLEIMAAYRKIATSMLQFSTFLMHGSVISTNNQGYMLTAPSGVGKTTRTKLWVLGISDSFVVNGDKPLLKVKPEGIFAYGTPWSGKENWNTNIGVRMRAIFLLERANGTGKNSVTEISFYEAFPILWQQTFQPDSIEGKRKTIQLLKGLIGKVKFYIFQSEPTVEAVKLAYEMAKPTQND